MLYKGFVFLRARTAIFICHRNQTRWGVEHLVAAHQVSHIFVMLFSWLHILQKWNNSGDPRHLWRLYIAFYGAIEFAAWLRLYCIPLGDSRLLGWGSNEILEQTWSGWGHTKYTFPRIDSTNIRGLNDLSLSPHLMYYLNKQIVLRRTIFPLWCSGKTVFSKSHSRRLHKYWNMYWMKMHLPATSQTSWNYNLLFSALVPILPISWVSLQFACSQVRDNKRFSISSQDPNGVTHWLIQQKCS